MTTKTISDLKVGDPVHYQPWHYSNDEFENGIVKEIPTNTKTMINVVYNCNNDWLNYTNYTSALTNLSDLKLGWRT